MSHKDRPVKLKGAFINDRLPSPRKAESWDEGEMSLVKTPLTPCSSSVYRGAFGPDIENRITLTALFGLPPPGRPGQNPV
jgi:hypothetical protein